MTLGTSYWTRSQLALLAVPPEPLLVALRTSPWPIFPPLKTVAIRWRQSWQGLQVCTVLDWLNRLPAYVSLVQQMFTPSQGRVKFTYSLFSHLVVYNLQCILGPSKKKRLSRYEYLRLAKHISNSVMHTQFLSSKSRVQKVIQ